MANLPESSVFDEGIYQIEQTDAVLGGVPDIATGAGKTNIPAWQLARRTRWLKNAYDSLAALVVDASTTVRGLVQLNNSLTSTSTSQALTAAQGKVLQDTKAPLVSPALAGTPTAPTASGSTNSGQIATTAFVQARFNALIAAAPGALDTLNELAAALGDDPNFATTITNALAAKAPLSSPALTGNPTATTQSNTDNSTRIATTAFVRNAMATIASAAGFDSGTSFAAGYVKLPSWLGGFIFQWVNASVELGGPTSGSWALDFPNTCLAAVPTPKGSAAQSISMGSTTSGWTAYAKTATGDTPGVDTNFCAIAIGR